MNNIQLSLSVTANIIIAEQCYDFTEIITFNKNLFILIIVV
jgi:hypothetical protein